MWCQKPCWKVPMSEVLTPKMTIKWLFLCEVVPRLCVGWCKNPPVRLKFHMYPLRVSTDLIAVVFAVSYQNTKTPCSTSVTAPPSLQMVHAHITSYHLFWTLLSHTHTHTTYAIIHPTAVSENGCILELPTNPLPASHCLFLTAGASTNPRRVSHHSEKLHW